MTYTAILSKMTVYESNPVLYKLHTENGPVELNPYLGKKIRFSFQGHIECLHCHTPIKKSYGQGYCYPCFITTPENEECVLRPELCKAHEGISRDMEYARNHCLQDHYVYLAATNNIKIGVTRSSQIPTRWIDQGAGAAVKIAKTPNRFTAGLIEVALKMVFPDKTNWRFMLTSDYLKELDFDLAFKKANENLDKNLVNYMLDSLEKLTVINYPILKYPVKVISIDLGKQNEIEATLIGIKGQYLIFDNGNAINIRKHGGYKIIFQQLD